MTTQVCDLCGHVDPHDFGPVRTVPFQPKGSVSFVSLSLQDCSHPGCHCDRPIWRDLLPTEPAL